MKIVEKVVYPIITKTRSVSGFYLNAIACQANHYGIVTDIDPESYRPVTINWDKNEPFAYTKDEIRVLKIEVVEQLLPQKTILAMPPATTVLLTNGEQVKFEPQERFLVYKVCNSTLVVKNITTKESYQFRLKDFPGNIYAHKIEPPKIIAKPVEELPLSLQELQYKAEIWLALNFHPIMLASLTPAIEQKLKHQLSQSLQQPFTSTNLDFAWPVALNRYFQEQARRTGLHGLKVGTKMLWQCTDEQLMFGQVTDINYHQRRFSLEWDDGKTRSFSVLEMKALSISIVSSVYLSDNVAYEISGDRSYLKAYIGFRTKKLAKAWLRIIKKIVGKLSNLKDYRRGESNYLSGTKWQYQVEQFRYKSMKRRLQSLETVSQLNLEKMPLKFRS